MKLLTILSGLILELLGAYQLAFLGFRKSRVDLLLKTAWWLGYRVSIPLGVSVTLLFVAAGSYLAELESWRVTTWALSIVAFLSWIPAASNWALRSLPARIEAPVLEEQSERLHRRGLIFLSIGFAMQGLGAVLL